MTKSKDVVYYSERQNVTITYFIRDENGKRIPERYLESGLPKTSPRGQTIYLHDTIKSAPLSVQKGSSYQSCFIITPEMEQRDAIIEAIERAMKDPGSKIFTADVWDKRKNPEAFAAIKERQKLENALDAKNNELLDAQAEIARLKKGK
jgi:hypothetical protein